MHPEIPTIASEAELLALLREAPAARAVLGGIREDDGVFVDVWECPNGDPSRPRRLLAHVETYGSAYALLDRAEEADLAIDEATWHRLPLRYGPEEFTWVLPEHPLAPLRPGDGAKRADLEGSGRPGCLSS